MAEIDSAIQEQLDELRDAVRGVRRLLVANGGNPHPAPAAPAAEGAVLLGQEEQADALRRVERTLGALPDRIAEALVTHFDVVEEEEPEPKGKGKPKAGAKAEGGEEEPEVPRRRYFAERTA